MSIKLRPISALSTILIAFVALSTIYSLVTQLKCGPDEPAHFIYIRSLALDKAFPEISSVETHSEESTSTHEGHQPPLYYILMAIPYVILHAFGASSDTIWRVLRLLGIPIGAAWIYFIYQLSMRYFKSEKRAIAATALIALIPGAAYTAGVVNNDILIAMLFTWALIPVLDFFQSGSLSMKSTLLMGTLMGLSILAKAQGLILIPVLLVAALAVLRRDDYHNYRSVGKIVLTALFVTAAVGGWWYVRCKIIYGTAMPCSLSNPVLVSGMIGALTAPGLALVIIAELTSMFWAHFWVPVWLISPYIGSPASFYYKLVAATLLVLTGLPIKLRRDKQTDRRSLWLLIFTAILTYIVYVRYVLVIDKMAAQQGRLYLPVAGVVGIVSVLSLEGWLKSPRAKKIGGIAAVVLMLLANVAVIACTVAYYATD